MGKQSKSGRSSKKNLEQNARWLEERLENTMLDIEALSSMPIEDVNAELKAFKPNQKAFVEALNKKLPAGASIPVPKAPAKRTRRKPASGRAADRKAAASKPTQERRSARIFSLKGAFVLSLLIIAGALFLPQLIRDFRDDKLAPAQATLDPTPEDLNKPPTWIVGPGVDELIRGVKYTIEGLEQVVINAPLPTNPGDLDAKFEMKVTIDGNGKVVGLEPISTQANAFEPMVVDSLLQWKFSALPASDTLTEAKVTVEYKPE